MTFCFARVRHALAAAIGVGSILAGLALAFRVVTPGLVQQLPTNELLGLLGLLALPPLTLWAFVADRRAAANTAAHMPESVGAESAAGFDQARVEPAVELVAEAGGGVEIHPPGRRVVHHRRHEPVRTIA
jgi:hypothetical protein